MLIHLFFFTLGYWLGAKHQRKDDEQMLERLNKIEQTIEHNLCQKEIPPIEEPAPDEYDIRTESQEGPYHYLSDELRDRGYGAIMLTPYQIRINNRLDIYPVNRRWHDLKNNLRGDYRNMHRFVDEFFAS